MKLIEALKILRQPVAENIPIQRVFLACGFTALHLQTFLAAHLRTLPPEKRVDVQSGLFGDLVGNIERAQASRFDAMVAVIEWQDLDQRLGIRSSGGWKVEDLPDIINSAQDAAMRLRAALQAASSKSAVCFCLPTLPLPPIFPPPTRQVSGYELRLRQLAASIAAPLADEPRIRILSAQQLDDASPPHVRFDANSELITGFPYSAPHASILAKLLAELVHSRTPMKGLITDLDDTLWAGILGEVGVNRVSWDFASRAQSHGLFQQFLASLASTGVLIAAASKNDRALVELALQRKDMILPKESLYPIEAHWGRKSESVGRILEKWHVGPEAVVLVDDSSMELAEVKSAFPEMECILFPKGDLQALWKLLTHLRDLFGKSIISQEDAIRLQSIRVANDWQRDARVSPDDFLQGARATIRFTLGKQVEDRRAFELVNKTNQFNLNGQRVNESEWIEYLKEPDTFLLTVSYDDKYGPLGEIAVLAGTLAGNRLFIDLWVMSCRAFSRRIEHQCLKYLFDKFPVDEIGFDFRTTERNGPLQDFFKELLHGPVESDLRLTRTFFFEGAPGLFHQVQETVL